MDAFYFIFITVSTIGFGDMNYNTEFMLQKDTQELTILFVLGFVLFCIAFSLIASLITTLTNLETERKTKIIRESKVNEKEDNTSLKL